MAGPERSSIVGDLIQLPRFDAAGAVALGEALLAVAAGVPELSRPITRAKDALEEDLASLRAAAAARLAAAAAATDPAVIAAADRALDGCWTALHDWLTGFSRLPEGLHEQAEGQALLAELYPDGLSFILLPYELEWDQSDQRLARIAGEPLGDRIRTLGGAVFLEALATAHVAYGRLLELPRPPGAQVGGMPAVAEALERFVSTLRVYALKVTAHIEVDEPGTADMAMTLLEPLLHWRARVADVERTAY
jgi:hypothetical protein